MRQLKKGVNVRSKEAKQALSFCNFLKDNFKIENYNQAKASIIFDEWAIKNIPFNVNWYITEQICYKILAFNGYENFFFAIEEDKNILQND